MTEQFYLRLLGYLNKSEKQIFVSHLQKKKFRVDGYRAIKYVPSHILAPLLSKNETAVVHAIKDLGGEYTSTEGALSDFKNGNVTKSFSYLMSKQEITEEQLLAIMNSVSAAGLSEDTEKEFEKLHATLTEIKAKNQALKKENAGLKKELSIATKEKETIEKKLRASNDTIIQLTAVIQNAQEKNKFQCQEIECVRAELGQRIQVLEKENAELRALNQEAAKAPVLVLLRERINIPLSWVLVRTYEFISSLNNENALDYSEILYVYNEMPLSLRIKIGRLGEAQKRVKTFTTNHELLQYIKEAR